MLKNNNTVNIHKEKVSSSFKDTPEMQKFIGELKILEEAIDEETSQLEQYKNPDFADINIRKMRGMHGLSRTMSILAAISDKNLQQEAEKRLLIFQKKLKRNSEILKMHLDAVSGLTDTLNDVQDHYETDGTYSPFLVSMRHIDG